MMGTGGSALVGRLLGEGEKEKANKTFSLIVYTTAIAGILLSALAFLLVPISIQTLWSLRTVTGLLHFIWKNLLSLHALLYVAECFPVFLYYC